MIKLKNLNEELMDVVLNERIWIVPPVTSEEAKILNEHAKSQLIKPKLGVAATLGKSLLSLCLHSRERLEEWDEIIIANDLSQKLQGFPESIEISDGEIKFLEKLMTKAKAHFSICSKFINEVNIGRAMGATKTNEQV